MKHLGLIACVILLGGLIVAVIARGSGDEGNFSQYPGFEAYFAQYPPRTIPPTAAEQQLLARHRPRFFLPKDHAGLISFYDDYVAQGVLKGPDRRLLSSRVTQALLNAHKENPKVLFEHRPDKRQPPTPLILGRVDYSDRVLDAGEARRFTLLTYHAVFRTSGIVGGVAFWQAIPLSIVGNLHDWHQLDHYTAATFVLDDTQRPVALMLQQHNYVRTYIYGETLSLPEDGRPAVDVAIRSNELYPHEKGRVRRRAVSFLDPKSLRYMLGAGAKPLMTADDLTEPYNEADYALHFLAPSDAFYTFKGALGKRRSLPGRSGPPGADYNTLPSLKPLHRQLIAGYWRPGNAADIAQVETALAAPDYIRAFVQVQAPVFRANMRCMMHGAVACRFR